MKMIIIIISNYFINTTKLLFIHNFRKTNKMGEYYKMSEALINWAWSGSRDISRCGSLTCSLVFQ